MPKYSDVKDTKITVQSIYSIFLRTLEDADTFRKNPRVSQYDTVDGRGRSLDSGRARYRRKKGWASDTVERYMSKNEAAFLLLCDQAEEISKVMYKYKLESAKKVYAFAKGKAKNPDLAKRSFLKNSLAQFISEFSAFILKAKIGRSFTVQFQNGRANIKDDISGEFKIFDYSAIEDAKTLVEVVKQTFT